MISNCIIIIVFLITNVHSARILGFGVGPSYSHQIVYQPLWRELSLRGHNVTVVTPNPINDPALTNLTEINVDVVYKFADHTEVEEKFGKEVNVFTGLDGMFIFFDAVVETELSNSRFQEILSGSSKQFDLLLVEVIHPIMCGLAGRFEAPLIGLSSFGSMTQGHDNVGNPTNPAWYSDVVLSFHSKSMTLWQKITSLFFNIWSKYYHHHIFLPRRNYLAKKYLNYDIPYLGQLQESQQMLFLNTNPYIEYSRPNVPAVVEMGQMHIKPVKALPKDLQAFLDGAESGAIYFSLGTNVGDGNISDKLLKIIISTLTDLPYKIIWKWSSETLPEKLDNVLVRKWVPQQDILAHPNMIAFVTQGGFQSLEESISRGVPLIVMPFIFDQRSNADTIVNLEIGLKVDPLTVTTEEFTNCITEVAKNDKFKREIIQLRQYLYDTPMTGLQRAVWWSEYVIRHKGAQYLKSPSAEISWFDYLLTDILLFIALVFCVVIYVSFKIVHVVRKVTNY